MSGERDVPRYSLNQIDGVVRQCSVLVFVTLAGIAAIWGPLSWDGLLMGMCGYLLVDMVICPWLQGRAAQRRKGKP